ncbi:outer membrane beta-barrel protein [Chitinophaga sp. CF418]|uniref:outer membrane beta-barrel protein n=1 Tax=Chitinophaga sp. CF418 TaxID=1855287 RepID=UPI00092319B3|nr:outer membrane beta-barrel protein [Chitinophaga sp. CF418]SHM77246.1 Outer membrane protein beta-barrel domain-containing protein [Chitinophaga sp. CF418]
MKKFVLLALLVISILPVYSQTYVGVIAGYNAATRYPRPNSSPGTTDYSIKSAWRAGLIADHHLWRKFYLQPQLLLNNKGEKYKYNGEISGITYATRGNTRLMFLELQANFIFKQQWGNGNFFAGAGPYLGRGINGKHKYEFYRFSTPETYASWSTSPVRYRRKADANNPIVYYQKPYDAGVSFQVGYEFKNGLFFNAVYSRGLTYQGYNPTGDKPKNAYWGVSMGYFLKKFS